MPPRLTPLEKYRRSVVDEFRRKKSGMLARIQDAYPEVQDIYLTGSVLEPDDFHEGSDVDVAISVPEGTPGQRVFDIHEGLRNSLMLMIGGGQADPVMKIDGRHVIFDVRDRFRRPEVRVREHRRRV